MSITFDKKDTNRRIVENFSQYLDGKFIQTTNSNLKISIHDSQKDKCIQAVDFISWAIFRKHEMNDLDYYNIIEPIILDENFLFK